MSEQPTPTSKPQPNPRGIELEYNSLRGEILKRIELRQQIISVTLTLAGVFLGFGLTTATVALVYPPLAAFLAFGWAQNDFRIRDLAVYIRTRLEGEASGLGYENYVQEARTKGQGLGTWRFVVLSHSGIFIFTQLMAVIIELAKYGPLAQVAPGFTPLTWFLLAVDAIAILAVIWVARNARR